MLSDNKIDGMCSTNVRGIELSEFNSDILIIKQNRKNFKSPTHFCKMCGYGDFSSTRVRRHLLLKHRSTASRPAEKATTSILADRLCAVNLVTEAEPESPPSPVKICDDLPEDLSVHSDISVSDNDENLQVVPQFKPTLSSQAENKRSVIVRTTPKKATKRSSPSAPGHSILKRRLMGEPVEDELQASEACLNASELNVKMVYHNSKFVIDSSESFWLKAYKLPPRYELQDN